MKLVIDILNNSTFTRAWKYWIAETNEENKLPINIALKMHNKKYPDEMFVHHKEMKIYGNSIRVGGHAGRPSPLDYNVTNCYHIDTQEGLNEFARVLIKNYE